MSERTNPYIRELTRETFRFVPNAEVLGLANSQKINQKVVLSFYGKKIDLPFKFVNEDNYVEILKDVAHIPEASHEVMEAYRLEITHPLGKMFCRFDIPKELTASTMTADAFSIAELNVRAKREFEDYLISRKQYDIEFSQMDLSHRQARLERKYEYINKGLDTAIGLVTFGASSWKAGAIASNWIKSSLQSARQASRSATIAYAKQWALDNRYVMKFGRLYKNRNSFSVYDPPSPSKFAPISFKGQDMTIANAVGAYKGFTGFSSGIVGLASISERAALQESGFALAIQEKALRSYEIDLGFEREKDEQLFTMRRLFASENYNEITDRQKQRVLDELESPAISDEIYLEVWTTSGEQKEYIDKYHDKYGVDCRVVKNEIPIRDDMRKGIYCIEDVEVYNLTDRVDFEYLKTRLTGGIKFIEWEEFKGEKEFHPVDERVKELQAEIVTIRQQYQQDDALTQETLKQLRDSNVLLHNQVAVDADRYHELTENYKKKEAELQTQTNLAVLYKNEADHFKADLLKKDSEHAQEKEDHSGTKQQLEEKTRQLEQKIRENQTLTSQIDSQLLKIQECEREKEVQQSKIQKLEQEVESNKDKNQEIETLKQQNQAQVQQINELAQKQLTTVQELEETKKSLEAVREIEKQLREQLGTAGVDIKHITQMINRFWVFQQADASRHPLKQISKYLAVVLKRDNAFVVTRIAFTKVKEYWIPYLALIEEDNEASAWPKLNKSKSLYKSESYGGFVLSQDTIKTTYWGTGYNSYYSKKITTWSDVKAHLLQYFSDPNGNKTTAIQMDYKYNFLFSEQWYPVFKKLVDNGKDWPDKSAKIIIGTYWDKTLKWFHHDHTVYIKDMERYQMLTTFQDYVKCLLGFDPWQGDS